MGVLQMRMSALFDAKTSDFLNLWCNCADKGRLSQYRQGRGEINFVQTSIMDGQYPNEQLLG